MITDFEIHITMMNRISYVLKLSSSLLNLFVSCTTARATARATASCASGKKRFKTGVSSVFRVCITPGRWCQRKVLSCPTPNSRFNLSKPKDNPKYVISFANLTRLAAFRRQQAAAAAQSESHFISKVNILKIIVSAPNILSGPPNIAASASPLIFSHVFLGRFSRLQSKFVKTF